jgi:hypothetical protein
MNQKSFYAVNVAGITTLKQKRKNMIRHNLGHQYTIRIMLDTSIRYGIMLDICRRAHILCMLFVFIFE